MHTRGRFECTHGVRDGRGRGRGGHRQFCLPKFACEGLSSASEVHQKKPLDLTHFKVREQVENNTFPIPPIIRFTGESCSIPSLLRETSIIVLPPHTHHTHTITQRTPTQHNHNTQQHSTVHHTHIQHHTETERQ